jgi:hypothetical protein
MMISDQQARLALESLHTQQPFGQQRTTMASSDIAPEFLERVKAELLSLPDTRSDRIEEARGLLAYQRPSAKAVAVMMVNRVISDAIR